MTTTYSMPSTRHAHSHVTLCVRDLRGKHGCTRTQAHRHTHTRKLWQRKEQKTYNSLTDEKAHRHVRAHKNARRSRLSQLHPECTSHKNLPFNISGCPESVVEVVFTKRRNRHVLH